MTEERSFTPNVLVDTNGMSEEEWLSWRRKGIGGSDAAAILGISPFRTARDIYYDKLNIAPVVDDGGNWVALRMGHLLEDLVAEIFAKKTGLRIFQIKKMFQHPQYPFMLADVDYFIELPDGRTALLEIKTTNYNAKDHWWRDGEEIVPPYYEAQGRHYMAVTGLDEVYFCCLYGNNEDETIIRHLTWDETYESELIAVEEIFWQENVLAKTPPPYTECGELITSSSRRYSGPADPQAPVMELADTARARLAQYLALQERKKSADANTAALKEELQRLSAQITAEMGSSCKAHCDLAGTGYTVSYSPVRKQEVNKTSLLRLKLLHPDIYKEYVTTSEYRRFGVKREKSDVA